MDLLRSFNVDELPEQQTRTLHLMDQNQEFDGSLGFDACCTCGKKFGRTCPSISCRNCRRVSYCSDACRNQDANVALPDDVEAEEEGVADTSLGHSAVICAVLRVCQDDEDVENSDVSKNLDSYRVHAARERIQSEKESYPATLANVISEGPCYTDVLRRCSVFRKLVIHVVGASTDGELWNTTKDDTSFVKAYAEALADLAASKNLDTIELIFVGPECPEQDVVLSSPMQSIRNEQLIGILVLRSIRGSYASDLLMQNDVSKADIVVFFNPGLTVPEYEWSDTLGCIQKGTPFLLTTNTELEGIADCQYLLDQDKIQSIPPGLAEIFGLYSANDDQNDEIDAVELSFFSENPFSGTRVRQNGTMANDLFVKNHWMLGGVIDSFDPTKSQKDSPNKKFKCTGNSKAGNPALI
jgi:hypothetical protein